MVVVAVFSACSSEVQSPAGAGGAGGDGGGNGGGSGSGGGHEGGNGGGSGSGGGNGGGSGNGTGSSSGNGTGSGAGSGSGTGGAPQCSGPNDVPDDGNPCANDICSEGQIVYAPASVDTLCNDTCHCDGLGQCAGPGCITDSICPPSPSPCLASKCVGCEECALLPEPSGKPAFGAEVPGDCAAEVCDGAGGVLSVPDDKDTQDDGDPCTVDGCSNGAPTHTPLCEAPEVCVNGACVTP